MSLYDTWKNTLENFSRAEAQNFFDDYYMKEKDAYDGILQAGENKISGSVKELSDKLNFTPMETVGFIDGINTSLEKEVEIKELEEASEVTLTINWEKLYLNMHKAKASWLYELEAWDGILSEEKRTLITKEYKDSLQVHTEHIGRNDPCPCGSGKKYKKCCGK